MIANEKNLILKASKILENNWRGTHTVPSPTLYPHQWNWDSGFIAIGYSYINQERSQKEILSLFEGQWANGMLPHIIFRSKDSYFPGPEYWEIDLSKYAPTIKTSGITQPPVQAIAALQIYKNAKDKKSAKSFLKQLFPKILAFHRYLLTKRDPEHSGLVTIFHPWESGLDNSIRWDEALARITVKDLPKYERVDLKEVSSSERPSKDTYDKYVYLMEIMKKYHYDEEKIYNNIPFKVKDIGFSTILYVANKAMLDIADILGESKYEIESWIKKTKENYFSYFCAKETENCLIYDFDLVANKKIEKRTIVSLLPICTDLLSMEQAEDIVSWMRHSHVCKENCIHIHPVVTSISVDEKEFNPLNYWRGPIWININWMLYKGLQNYGFYTEAEMLRNAIIDLVAEHGFYEYYNPLSGEGLGTNNFSWTASLLIDLLLEKEEKYS
ncbi:MAG: trehalase family glycosidase [Methanosarcinales archaeon]